MKKQNVCSSVFLFVKNQRTLEFSDFLEGDKN